MTKVIFIVGRTDKVVSFHDKQFIRETDDLQLAQFVTTSSVKQAKKFKDSVTAMRFLAKTCPDAANNGIRQDMTLPCYEVLILDSAEVSTALSHGRAPQALRGNPQTSRVFCSTLGAQNAPRAAQRGV